MWNWDPFAFLRSFRHAMQNPAKTFSWFILLCFEVLVNQMHICFFSVSICSLLSPWKQKWRELEYGPSAHSSRPSTEVAEHGKAQVTQKARMDTTMATYITFKLRTWLEWVDGDVAISNLVMVIRPSQQRMQWKDCSASWYSNARCNLQAEAVASPALDDLKQEVGVTFKQKAPLLLQNGKKRL